MDNVKVIAPASQQQPLFYQPPVINCDSNASARNAFGIAAQELVYQCLGVTPIPINGNYTTCFDGVKDGTYYEIKSTKLSGGKVVVYDWRMEKEAAAGVPLRYLIVCHKISGQREDVLAAMASKPVTIYSVPAEIVYRVAYASPLNTIKRDKVWSKRNGYEREGYKNGYRNISLRDLAAAVPFVESRVENTLGAGVIRLFMAGGEANGTN